MLRFRIGVAFALLFFLERDLKSVDRLGGQFFPGIGPGNLVDEQHGRSAVENDMMEVDIGVVPIARAVDFNAEQRILEQVHGPAEAGAHGFEGSDFLHVRVPRLAGMVFQAGRSFLDYQAGEDIRMRLDHFFESGGEAVGVDRVRQAVQGSLLVVAALAVQPLACQVDAQLGLGKGIGHRFADYGQN